VIALSAAGFSSIAIEAVFASDIIVNAAERTLYLRVMVITMDLLLGVPAAIPLSGRFQGARSDQLFLLSPIMLTGIVIGISIISSSPSLALFLRSRSCGWQRSFTLTFLIRLTMARMEAHK